MLETELEVQQVGNASSFPFKTDTGVPQGNSASVVEFTYYLAMSLKDRPNEEHNINEHNYCLRNQERVKVSVAMRKKESCTQYSKITRENCVGINMEYADDMTEVTTEYKLLST